MGESQNAGAQLRLESSQEPPWRRFPWSRPLVVEGIAVAISGFPKPRYPKHRSQSCATNQLQTGVVAIKWMRRLGSHMGATDETATAHAFFAKWPDAVRAEDCYWYHTMDIPGFGTTPGNWDLRGKFPDYIGNVSVTGRTVLDIGAASSFLSFSAEQNGAREVVSFDIDRGERQHLLPFHNSLYFRNHAAWAEERTALFTRWKNAYWFAHRAYHSMAHAVYGDIYNIPQALGVFDVVIVGAVLEHLSDPIRALASISRVTGQTMIINTAVLNTDQPLAEFMGNSEKPQFDYVFWTYSLGVYRHVLRLLGFEISRLWEASFLFNDLNIWAPRTAIVAQRI